jgi:hypothetical protein
MRENGVIKFAILLSFPDFFMVGWLFGVECQVEFEH